MAQHIRRIALYGGAFDPPHIGHAVAIRQILDTKKFDEVWIVPSGIRQDKKSYALPQDRLLMMRLLVRTTFGLREKVKVIVKSHLIKQPSAFPFTVQEIEYLKKKFKGIRFTVAVGADQAQVLHYWHNAERLFQITDFLILARDGRPANIHPKCRAIIIDPEDTIWINISSTELRKRVKHGQSILGLTTIGITKFIEKKNLYKKEG